MKSNIRIYTEGFRAINKADIIIDGITLVAGVNGCGKSTISKLLYFLYKTVANYDGLVKQKLRSSLQDVVRLLDIFQQEIVLGLKDKKVNDEFRKEIIDLRRGFYQSEFLEDELSKWITLVEKVEYLYANHSNKSSDSGRSSRINNIIKNILKDDQFEGDLGSSFQSIKKFIKDKFKEAIGKINSRPTSLFTEELKRVFSNNKLPRKFDVFEYDDVIISLEKSNLSIPFNIQTAIYIDTPMMISVEDSHNEHWEDLNDLLLRTEKNFRNDINDVISGDVISGDVDLDEGIYSADEFKFNRIDGSVFNLLDVATGIKSFSILQLLIKSGQLNDKTLLIIDEPESNLHPQWIIEYARIIVMMNKIMGVKFFLASHDPDMVSAIRYISEKEGSLDVVNFYLATKTNEKFVYDYKYLGKEIDPIFESFNIALERINRYGV
jgi:energy-coupling factor transporter ATP-binding protein EcfA2